MSLIELNHITKIYQTGETALKALDEIDLSINKHELIAIMGTSGSGKSTLMNMIGLLDRPTSGTILFNDKKTSTFTDDNMAYFRNEKIGFVFQTFFLLSRLNVERNTMLPLLYRGMNIKQARKEAYTILEKLGIARLYHHKPYQLSGGEQQRVAIARALVGNPDIILADEPTGSLDSKTGQEVIDLFIQLHQQENRTIIMVTHNADIAAQFHRTIMLKDGKIVKDTGEI